MAHASSIDRAGTRPALALIAPLLGLGLVSLAGAAFKSGRRAVRASRRSSFTRQGRRLVRRGLSAERASTLRLCRGLRARWRRPVLAAPFSAHQRVSLEAAAGGRSRVNGATSEPCDPGRFAKTEAGGSGETRRGCGQPAGPTEPPDLTGNSPAHAPVSTSGRTRISEARADESGRARCPLHHSLSPSKLTLPTAFGSAADASMCARWTQTGVPGSSRLRPHQAEVWKVDQKT